MPWQPGQSGNPEGARIKARRFGAMLERVLTQEDLKPEEQHRLRLAVEKLVQKAADGDIPSMQMLADRLDGKPAQQVQLQGDPDLPLVGKIIREVKEPDAK